MKSVYDKDYVRVSISNVPPAPPTVPVGYKPPMTSSQVEEARKAAAALIAGFRWSESAEGSDFWLSVYERLLQVASTGDHTK